jgi:superfamily II DNA/RNA helicase
LVGKAFTGSGKTLAFAIPIINKILNSENTNRRNPKCLVLTPTRELCIQLTETIQKLAGNLRCVSIYGGAGYNEQKDQLSHGVDIVCATPGRLNDLIQSRNLCIDDINLVCLDEADEMLKPSFLESISYILEENNQQKQILMFSATINKNVEHLVRQYTKVSSLIIFFFFFLEKKFIHSNFFL